MRKGSGRRSNSNVFSRAVKKPCPLCAAGIKIIDYKDVDLLLNFLTPGGAILPRRVTGVTNENQRRLAKAIKRARVAGMLPFRVV